MQCSPKISCRKPIEKRVIPLEKMLKNLYYLKSARKSSKRKAIPRLILLKAAAQKSGQPIDFAAGGQQLGRAVLSTPGAMDEDERFVE